ncbi:class I SAM-dependent methyltransferase [Nocardia sp. 2]|uniref:Class I SAM-dependent methyltransferase n=1 Tax=Nocardia acididurans TaxID=2802282 RepID=A0ABS1MCT2_9NOCA|nr:class I SAM-dependent methyltransferase [Nocardia acididurans]MBL1077529.1 class I SAM-dependent methyltransferase [Nocardia acididurans]
MSETNSAALDGVPATALWILWSRAVESARADSEFSDPLAEQLCAAIDFDYSTFGSPRQTQVLRALAIDTEIRRFQHDSPGGTVVALGEGLQTTYWRLGEPELNWLSVDLPEMIALRERLLPAAPRVRNLALSALDRSWFDAVDTREVLITAEGLFMYLEPDDVYALIGDMAQRFPGASVIFDALPPSFTQRTAEGRTIARGSDYVIPPMPFGLTVPEARALPQRIPGVTGYRELPMAAGRGWCHPALLGLHRRLPLLRDHRHFIAQLSFE